MTNQDLDLSIVIVNWNSVRDLKQCLTSIYRNVEGLSYEVLVIDNASWDGCAEMLERHFPAVRFSQSRENTGFAKANNYCFSQSRGRNILFLNPDTEIVGSAIQVLLRSLEEIAGAGIVGPRLLNSDGSVQTSCIQRFPTILNQLLDSDWLRRKCPASALWGTSPLTNGSNIPVAVEVISGACLMIRRELFVATGGFDEGYFMYSEDVDLCFEAQRLGSRRYYVPAAQVVHHGGRSSGLIAESHFAATVARDSLFRFMRMQYGWWYAATYRMAMALSAVLRLLMIPALMMRARGDRRAAVKLIVGKWFTILRWAFGRTKNHAKFSASNSANRQCAGSNFA